MKSCPVRAAFLCLSPESYAHLQREPAPVIKESNRIVLLVQIPIDYQKYYRPKVVYIHVSASNKVSGRVFVNLTLTQPINVHYYVHNDVHL